MTEKTIYWVVSLTPEEVEVSKVCLEALASYPRSLLDPLDALAKATRDKPELRDHLGPTVARLVADAMRAHDCMEWLRERMRKGQFNECTGAVQ